MEIQIIVHMQYSKGLTPIPHLILFMLWIVGCYWCWAHVYQWNDDIQTDIGLGIKEPTFLL